MSSKRLVGLVAGATVLILVAGACGAASTTPPATSAPAGSSAARSVDLQIAAGSITPSNVDVKKGETITFNAKNVSDTEVEIIVGLQADVAADSGDSLKEAEHIAPGATGSVTYTFDKDGPWGYGDQVGDHYAKGAKGTITIVP